MNENVPFLASLLTDAYFSLFTISAFVLENFRSEAFDFLKLAINARNENPSL